MFELIVLRLDIFSSVCLLAGVFGVANLRGLLPTPHPTSLLINLVGESFFPPPYTSNSVT